MAAATQEGCPGPSVSGPHPRLHPGRHAGPADRDLDRSRTTKPHPHTAPNPQGEEATDRRRALSPNPRHSMSPTPLDHPASSTPGRAGRDVRALPRLAQGRLDRQRLHGHLSANGSSDKRLRRHRYTVLHRRGHQWPPRQVPSTPRLFGDRAAWRHAATSPRRHGTMDPCVPGASKTEDMRCGRPARHDLADDTRPLVP